ncbi:Putative Mg2+ and Co2+ transporter CorB [Actinobacillus pleuropneumoniae]|nr:Putative Mg2+ and Co2+ transporter CorB [Actinobacillus pleuropneumoniae]
MPKRLAMTYPGKNAVRTIGVMMFCIALFKPLVLFFDWIANTLFKFSTFLPYAKTI